MGISFTYLAPGQGWQRTPTRLNFSAPVSGAGGDNGSTLLLLLLEILMGRMNGVGGGWGGIWNGERGGRGFPGREWGDVELNRGIYGIENVFLNGLPSG